MKIIFSMPEVKNDFQLYKNDFQLYMKAPNILVVKENKEMFVVLEDPTDQIA